MNIIARFLPNLIPGLGALANPWIWLVAVAIALAGFTAGWKVEGWRWSASLKDIAEANVKFVQDFHRRDNKANAVVSARLSRDRAKLDRERSEFQRKLANERRAGSIITISEPNPEDGKATPGGKGLRLADRIAVCDSRCIGLWNDGLTQGLPDAYDTGRVDGTPSAAGSVAADDLIDNAAENFALGNKFRSQILGWQRLACEKGWWAGPECGALRKLP